MVARDQSTEFEKYYTLIDEVNSRFFDDGQFVQEAIKYLVNLDREGFRRLVGQSFASAREEWVSTAGKSVGIHSIVEGGFLAGSFQYDSAVFGQWLRFRFLDKGGTYYSPSPHPLRAIDHPSLYTKLDEEFFEDLLNEAPREDSLLFNQHLKKPLCVQFGGPSHRPSDFANVGYLWVSRDKWSAFQDLIYKVHPITFRELLLSRPSDLEDVLGDNTAKKVLIEFDTVLREKCFGDRGCTWLGGFLGANQTGTAASPTRKADWAKLLRLFLFTYFYTIMHRPSVNDSAIYHLILPIFVGNEWIGSFCGAYARSPNKRIPYLQRIYGRLFNRFCSIECLALQELPSARLSITESMVRLCHVIPMSDETPPIEMSKWRNELISRLSNHHPLNDKGDFIDGDLNKIATGLVSASNAMFTLLDRIQSRFVDEVDPATQHLRPQAIFLHSEPGLGKESISRLCHYFSQRSYSKEIIQDRIKTAWEEAQQPGAKWNKKEVFARAKGLLDLNSLQLTRSWKANRSFNYDFKNCGTLQPDHFIAELFGTRERPGLLSGTSMLAGTVFLDEVNTAHKDVINGLLRALESPFTVEPEGNRPRVRLNLLVIFASNIPLDQLVTPSKFDFNPAFADRINAVLNIPPLADRKEDIPLIINKLLQEKNRLNPGAQHVRFVDLAGLRLLMELPWERNVRTIKNFVDDLMNARRTRTLSKEAFQTVTFEEIIEWLVKGRYFGSSSRSLP